MLLQQVNLVLGSCIHPLTFEPSGCIPARKPVSFLSPDRIEFSAKGSILVSIVRIDSCPEFDDNTTNSSGLRNRLSSTPTRLSWMVTQMTDRAIYPTVLGCPSTSKQCCFFGDSIFLSNGQKCFKFLDMPFSKKVY